MSLHSLDMDDYDVEDDDRDVEETLKPTAIGGLSLQQLPYECPDSSFEFTTDSDILKPVIVKSYKRTSKVPRKSNRLSHQVMRPASVPNLNDVQPFMSSPDNVGKSRSDLEALLLSQHIQNPQSFYGPINILPSDSTQPPDSDRSTNSSRRLGHALAHAWKFDPFRSSAKEVFKLSQGPASGRRHGLTKKEYEWFKRKGKWSIVKNVRIQTQAVDFQQARRYLNWMKRSPADNDILNMDSSNLDKELDEYYGHDDTDLRPVDSHSDEGFFEPSNINTITVSLPSSLDEKLNPVGTFQDSAISMDKEYAEYSLAHSVPNSAKDMAGTVPRDGATLDADVVPLRTPNLEGRWLGLIGDQKQCGWPGRRQGSHDLNDLRSRKSNHTLDVPSNGTKDDRPLLAEAALSTEPAHRVQKVSEPVLGIVNSVPFESTSRSPDKPQPSVLQSNDEDSTSNKQAERNKVSVNVVHSATEERPQHFSGSVENGSDSGPSVPAFHGIREVTEVENDTSAHARHGIHNAAFTTPMNQRNVQTQHVQVDTPATPSTINVHLTPIQDGNTDSGDTSNASLEVCLPDSPTKNTRPGPSALSSFVQVTNPHPNPARHSSSTTSLDGGEFDELSLISTQDPPGQLKGHVGFSKAVQTHQKKSDALFTLSPVKASQDMSSPKKIAPNPVTPANGNKSPPSRPATPFQLGTPALADFDSPGTPTPAPKARKSNGKSVMNVFNSPRLGSRSPEHAKPNPDIIVAPTVPAIGATAPHGGHFVGSQGLLFQKGKKNERSTKNVLNSMKLSPERKRGGYEAEDLDDYADELAGGGGADALEEGKGPQGTPSLVHSGQKRGRKVAQAVMVPRARAHDLTEGLQIQDDQKQEPQRKKVRRSTRIGEDDVMDL